MRAKIFIVFVLIGILGNAQESIYDIIKTDSCPGNEVVGDPELYVGDDLFNLINGGAELYHEFGFIEVLATEMSIPGGEPVKVEIYDMGSSESAWGIYSLTATSASEPFHAEAEGRHGEGFSQFVKGNYMVYFYHDQVEATELQYVAGCISENIEEYAERPEVMKAVDPTGEAERIVYYKGNLGLSSIYSFHYKDVFKYTEGAAAIFPDVEIFLLNYEEEGSCIDHYNEARNFFMSSGKYHDQLSLRGSFHMKDRKEQQIDCYFENTFLIIFMYEGEMDINPFRESIVDNFEKL